MAHKGSIWPVLYRRDLNLNIQNNSIGWPRRFLGRLDFSVGGVGSIVAGKTFDCGPDFYSQINEIDWQSDFRQIGVAKYRMEILVQVVRNREYFRQVSIGVQNQGTILVCEQFDNFHPDHPGFNNGAEMKVVFFSTDWFDHQPPFLTGTFKEKRWTDGPPH